MKFHFDSHPEFGEKPAGTLEIQLWEKLAEGGVLLAPGWFFAADREDVPDGNREGHYRIPFSAAAVRFCIYRSFKRLTRVLQFPEMERAIDIIAKVTKLFFDGE